MLYSTLTLVSSHLSLRCVTFLHLPTNTSYQMPFCPFPCIPFSPIVFGYIFKSGLCWNISPLSNPTDLSPSPSLLVCYPLPGICRQSHLNCSLTTYISTSAHYFVALLWQMKVVTMTSTLNWRVLCFPESVDKVQRSRFCFQLPPLCPNREREREGQLVREQI